MVRQMTQPLSSFLDHFSHRRNLSLQLTEMCSEGTNEGYPTLVAIKGTVFDVSGNKAYGPEGSYKGMSTTVANLT